MSLPSVKRAVMPPKSTSAIIRYIKRKDVLRGEGESCIRLS